MPNSDDSPLTPMSKLRFPIIFATGIALGLLAMIASSLIVKRAVLTGYVLGEEVGHARGLWTGRYIGRQECENSYGYPPPAHGLDVEPVPSQIAQ